MAACRPHKPGDTGSTPVSATGLNGPVRGYVPIASSGFDSQQLHVDGKTARCTHEPVLKAKRRWYWPFYAHYHFSCVMCEIPEIPAPKGMVYRILVSQMKARHYRGEGTTRYREPKL